MTRRQVQFGLGDLTRWPELVASEPTPPPQMGGAPLPDVPRVFVHSGNVMVAVEPALATTILGSCVAVCLWDATRRIGGLNHFLLPWEADDGQTSERYGRTAIEALVGRMESRGVKRTGLQAKVFGGASVLDAPVVGPSLGSRNVATARECLAQIGVPIVAEDVGGTQGRKLFFHTADGSAWVRKL